MTIDQKALERRPATFTVDQDEVAGNLYYFALTDAAKPPYRTQRHVNAILDIAEDGTLAGVELIDDMPPPPDALPASDHAGLVERLNEAADYFQQFIKSAQIPVVQSAKRRDVIREAATAISAGVRVPDENELARRLSVQLMRWREVELSPAELLGPVRSALSDTPIFSDAPKFSQTDADIVEATAKHRSKLYAASANLGSKSDAPVVTDSDIRTKGREFLEAAEAVFDWMNGNDLSADHEAQHPEDFDRVSSALVAFRAALSPQSGEQS